MKKSFFLLSPLMNFLSHFNNVIQNWCCREQIMFGHTQFFVEISVYPTADVMVWGVIGYSRRQFDRPSIHPGSLGNSGIFKIQFSIQIMSKFILKFDVMARDPHLSPSGHMWTSWIADLEIQPSLHNLHPQVEEVFSIFF